MQNATLLHATLPPVPACGWAEELLEGLPYAWRLQVGRRAPAARFASLAGLALVLHGATRLCGSPPPLRTLERGTDGKPRFATGPTFSISHAETRVAAVLTQHGEVGLDLESLDGLADRERLRRWTATEAALKAAGLGLRRVEEVHLDAVGAEAVVRGRRYRLMPLTLAPDVVAHLAADEALALEICEIQLGAADLSASVERSLCLTTQR